MAAGLGGVAGMVRRAGSDVPGGQCGASAVGAGRTQRSGCGVALTWGPALPHVFDAEDVRLVLEYLEANERARLAEHEAYNRLCEQAATD